MVYSNSTVSFEKMLMKFMSEADPMLSMLKWLCEQLMEAEVTSKVNAAKSERTPERSGYRSGYRVRRFDTRMGSICFLQVLFPRFCKLLFAATPQGILRVALH
jgi:transposase-like protein